MVSFVHQADPLEALAGTNNYILVNIRDLDRACALLASHLGTREIFVNLHSVSINGEGVVAISSADPEKFHFGYHEADVLTRGDVNNILAGARSRHVHVRTMEELQARPDMLHHLGLTVPAGERTRIMLRSLVRKVRNLGR
jgi:hypothetical protein